MFRRIVALVFVVVVAGIGGLQAPSVTLSAQSPAPAADSQRLSQLFGAFCALWAQNTRRNPWGWFFLGLFFSVITVFVLLWKNADDLLLGRGAPVQ